MFFAVLTYRHYNIIRKFYDIVKPLYFKIKEIAVV